MEDVVQTIADNMQKRFEALKRVFDDLMYNKDGPSKEDWELIGGDYGWSLIGVEVRPNPNYTPPATLGHELDVFKDLPGGTTQSQSQSAKIESGDL